MPTPAAVPGLTGIDHIGLTVPDVEVASRFFADVIGAEALYDIGPFESADEWMAQHLAVDPRSRIHRLRVLKVANGPVLELFELRGPEASAGEQRNASYGGWHMAFYVDDMDKALLALKAHGVRILSGPVTMTEGPSAGMEWLYFQAPWGQQLELVSYPGGIATYKQLRREVWRPR
jgi:catechol 2,3-dioxygenase-like lactoylglutathione lyase family enzyme